MAQVRMQKILLFDLGIESMEKSGSISAIMDLSRKCLVRISIDGS